jgi:hypothetical protein
MLNCLCAAALAHMIKTVPRSDETRARIAQLIDQGGGDGP